ncbi:MAG: hypothetical protein ACR2KP_16570 [Egibacteraceae bacterium]
MTPPVVDALTVAAAGGGGGGQAGGTQGWLGGGRSDVGWRGDGGGQRVGG